MVTSRTVSALLLISFCLLIMGGKLEALTQNVLFPICFISVKLTALLSDLQTYKKHMGFCCFCNCWYWAHVKRQLATSFGSYLHCLLLTDTFFWIKMNSFWVYSATCKFREIYSIFQRSGLAVLSAIHLNVSETTLCLFPKVGTCEGDEQWLTTCLIHSSSLYTEPIQAVLVYLAHLHYEIRNGIYGVRRVHAEKKNGDNPFCPCDL